MPYIPDVADDSLILCSLQFLFHDDGGDDMAIHEVAVLRNERQEWSSYRTYKLESGVNAEIADIRTWYSYLDSGRDVNA